MSASFSEFKLDIGIKNPERDTEYSAILKGLIKELFSTYGIAISKDVLSHTETINTLYNTPIELVYKNIVDLTIIGFTENIDYTLDRVTGTLVLLDTGTMIEGTDYDVTYDYYLFINESNSYTHIIYPALNETIYHIDVKPYEILNVTYNGADLIPEADYYHYNNTLELITAPSNIRTPIRIEMEIGYENMPNDLKQSFYELANIRFDMRDKKTYLISKVSDNAQGNSTTYRLDSLPKHIKTIFEEYTGRRFMI